MIYCYTSILNGFDNLRPPAVQEETFVKYICFTNVPNLPRVTPWEYRPAYMLDGAGRSSRAPKILPHLLLPRDAEYSIWQDGNFQLRRPAEQAIAELLTDGRQWAAHQHPCRNCVYDEAGVILNHADMAEWRRTKPEATEDVRRQVEKYQAAGFPRNAGLWANGFIVRRHTPEVARLNELWWKEFAEGSERDQLSFPPARCKAGVEINTIAGAAGDANIFASPWLLHRWHAAWKRNGDNPDFWAERNVTRDRLAELARVTGTDSGIAWLDY